MRNIEISPSNQWLAFTDDLTWKGQINAAKDMTLRSLVCQQLLFNETCIIPDSWWLSNPLLQHVFSGDLSKAIEQQFVVVALSDTYEDSGIYGRYIDLAAKPAPERLAGFVCSDTQGAFLRNLDEVGAAAIYSSTQVGKFFSNIVTFAAHHKDVLRAFGLEDVQPLILHLVEEKRAAKQLITASDLYNLFAIDKTRQLKMMSMTRPIYVMNAPLIYGYNVALAGGENDPLYTSILRLLRGLSENLSPELLFTTEEVNELCAQLDIENPIFRDAGWLTYEEIEGARAMHFGPLRQATCDFAEKKIGAEALEQAYRSYESNISDYLAKRNARFDVALAHIARGIATASEYAAKTAGMIAREVARNTGLDSSSSLKIGVVVSIMSSAIVRALSELATDKEQHAIRAGHDMLITRLDIWKGERRLIEDGRLVN